MLGAAAGLGGWFVGMRLFPICVSFQRSRQHSATAAHRALPVGEWPALGMPWGTARSNAASGVCAAGVVEPAVGSAAGPGRWFMGVAVFPLCGRFPEEEEAALGNHSAQSPASV